MAEEKYPAWLAPENFLLLADYISKNNPDLSVWELTVDKEKWVINKTQIKTWLTEVVGLDPKLIILETAEDWQKIKAKVALLNQGEEGLKAQQVDKVKMEAMQQQLEKAREAMGTETARREKLIQAFMKKLGMNRQQAEEILIKIETTEGEMAEKNVSQMAKDGSVPVKQSEKSQPEEVAAKVEKSKFRSKETSEVMGHLEERAAARGFGRREPFQALYSMTMGNLVDYLQRMGIIEGGIGLIQGNEDDVFVPEMAEAARNYEEAQTNFQALSGMQTAAGFIKDVGQQVLQDKATAALEQALGISRVAVTATTTAVETGAATAATAGAATAAGATAAGATAAAGGTVAAAAGPVGWAVAAGLLIKEIPGLVKKLVGWFGKNIFGGFGKESALNAGSGAQVFAKKNLGGLLSFEGMGALLGAIVGSIVSPIPIVGTILGGVLGGIIGGAVGSMARSGGEGAGGLGGDLASKAKKAGIIAVLAGTSMESPLAFAFIGLAILLLFNLINFGMTSEIFAQKPLPAGEDQGKSAAFVVTKSAETNPASLLGYTVGPATITYTLEIKASDNDFQVTGISDEVKRFGKNDSGILVTANKETPALPAVVITKGTSYTTAYKLVISGAEFKDTTLINVATVKGHVVGQTSEITETATAVVAVGNPPDEQPFGYPAMGTITSLDALPKHSALVDGKVTTIFHCGTFLPDRGCLIGGMDVARGGNEPVYSTVDGVVTESTFDKGPKTDQCDPATSSTGFCYPALGGVVYIQSADGKYTLAFLHLADEGRAEAKKTVKRGDQIGVTYKDKICDPTNGQCASSGPHVHYQILLNSANLNFETAPIGTCANGAILPVKPVIGLEIGSENVAKAGCQ